ncbi:MAG: FG-GAP repeat domain-containing protein, partial [Bacteroidia bacterium]
MKKIYLSILFIAVSFFANAQVCLKPTTYPNGSSFIVNGDFNNDGKLDVVDSRSDSMRTWFGDGSGNLTLGTTAHVPYSGNIITNDFNKDGNADIVLTNNSMSSTNIMLALGTGTGSFGTPATFAVGSAPMNMLSADFNADSNPDVAAMGENLSGGINGFSVLIGDGAGNFGTHTDYTVGMYTSDITGGDFNGDSKYDIAVGFNVGNGQGGKIAVFLGDGLGGFGTPTNFTFGGYDPYSLCVADFNQDGKLDIAGSTGNSNAVVIMTGNGAGSFSATTTYMLGKQCEDILSADFNSDGKADLATADVNANYVSVLIGNGAGNFTNSINFPDAFVSRTILSGDYDSDGKPDLVAGNTQGDNFMLFLNVPAPNLSLTSSNPSALCSNASATLTVSGATTYTWSTNSGVPSPRDSINPSDSSIIHIPGNYTVTQVVVTPTANTTYSVIAQTNGCADSASFSYNIVMP